ncbi:MAG TPA: hypothetical protein VHN77_06085 [Phycisphaerales bacterium]|nr:hypothetical protein [Phycisphaerales bacterium]
MGNLLHKLVTGSSLACAIAALSPCAVAQCPREWTNSIGTPGVNRFVGALTTVDPDGPGAQPPLLAVAGDFTLAGGGPASRVAQYDPGSGSWTSLGSGVGGFTHPFVFALAPTPAGGLFVGGFFLTAGGAPAPYVAHWDGSAWSPLGAGLDGYVNALTLLPDGDLVAGGVFSNAGGSPAAFIARWDGALWHPMGNGVDGPVMALATAPNGDVIVGGSFQNAGGNPTAGVARWDGAVWLPMGVGMDGSVNALAVSPAGDVLAGGYFQTTGSNTLNHIARWDGSTWQPLGTGTNAAVLSIAATGTDVYAAGLFTSAGGAPAGRIARWDGAAWHALDTGLDGDARAVAAMPDGRVFTGGFFSSAGGLPAGRIAEWSEGTPAAIITSPSDASVCAGGVASFTVAGSGSAPLAYQWQYLLGTDWTDITSGPIPALGTASGAATTTLSVSDPIDGAQVRARVSNLCASVDSTPATLTVPVPCCDSIDINGDSLLPDIVDLFDFLSIFSGGPCSTGSCGDIDFNNDGSFPDTADIDSLLSVFSGGACL